MVKAHAKWHKEQDAEFRAWLVRAVFGANSEQIPSELRVPSKLRANSEQASQTLYFLVILCSKYPWLADSKEHVTPWGETDHARNLAEQERFPAISCDFLRKK